MAAERPQLWIIAGPNGAGKSTLVTHRVGRRIPVVNPDEIAATLPLAAGHINERRAGEIALRLRAELLDARASFAIETTLSGSSTFRFMTAARMTGHKITLVYIGLSSDDLSLQRVADRVRRGGHAVPVNAVCRRYPDSMSRLAGTAAFADRTLVLDNSGLRRRLLLSMEAGRIRFITRQLPAWFRRALPDLA